MASTGIPLFPNTVATLDLLLQVNKNLGNLKGNIGIA